MVLFALLLNSEWSGDSLCVMGSAIEEERMRKSKESPLIQKKVLSSQGFY